MRRLETFSALRASNLLRKETNSDLTVTLIAFAPPKSCYAGLR